MGSASQELQALSIRLQGGDPNQGGLAFDIGSQISVGQGTSDSKGYQSIDNSTTTTLSSGATFTGTGEQNQFANVGVSCFSDTDGTLFFDFSVNGTDWRVFPTNGFVVTANIHEFHTAVKLGRFFRVRFVNSASVQSTFQLFTYYGSSFLPINSPLNQTLGNDADSLVVRQYAQKVDLALGRLGGITEKDKFGYIRNLGVGVDIATPASWVDVWAFGGQRTSPTSSFTPFMASDDAADTNIDIKWTYHDANGVEQTVTVSTDGSDGRTPVSLGVTATEVYRGFNDSTSELAGNVSCMTESDFTNGVPNTQSKVLAYINSVDEQTQVLAFRIPASKYGIIGSINVTIARSNGSASSVLGAADIRENGKIWRSIRPFSISTTAGLFLPDEDILLEPLTDFRIRIRDVSDNNTDVTAIVKYLVIDQ